MIIQTRLKNQNAIVFPKNIDFICFLYLVYQTAVSHIPQSGDATRSPAGDATSPTGDVDVSAGDAYL